MANLLTTQLKVSKSKFFLAHIYQSFMVKNRIEKRYIYLWLGNFFGKQKTINCFKINKTIKMNFKGKNCISALLTDRYEPCASLR